MYFPRYSRSLAPTTRFDVILVRTSRRIAGVKICSVEGSQSPNERPTPGDRRVHVTLNTLISYRSVSNNLFSFLFHSFLLCLPCSPLRHSPVTMSYIGLHSAPSIRSHLGCGLKIRCRQRQYAGWYCSWSTKALKTVVHVPESLCLLSSSNNSRNVMEKEGFQKCINYS